MSTKASALEGEKTLNAVGYLPYPCLDVPEVRKA